MVRRVSNFIWPIRYNYHYSQISGYHNSQISSDEQKDYDHSSKYVWSIVNMSLCDYKKDYIYIAKEIIVKNIIYENQIKKLFKSI